MIQISNKHILKLGRLISRLVIPCSIILVAAQCTIPLDTESFNYEQTLVVDGIITDEFTNHEIILKYTKPIDGDIEELVDDASVFVETNDGDQIDFTFDPYKGSYVSSEPFACETGKTYQLIFIMDDNEEYRSSINQYVASPPIDSIYDRYAESAPDGATSNEGGIQFFIDSHSSDTEAHYFRYEWEEDYKIITPTQAFERYIVGRGIIEKEYPTHICYAHDESASTIIGNNLDTKNSMVEFPVRFVPGSSDLLRNRYSILVKQYSIDANAYAFYSRFKKLNESSGSLFDKQIGTVAGNIRSMSDPNKIVLGYFEVAGVTEKRAFFNFQDLDPAFSRPEYRGDCGPEFVTITTYQQAPTIGSYGIDLDVIGYYQGISAYPMITNKNCTDCTGYGPTSPPDYWIE